MAMRATLTMGQPHHAEHMIVEAHLGSEILFVGVARLLCWALGSHVAHNRKTVARWHFEKPPLPPQAVAEKQDTFCTTAVVCCKHGGTSKASRR